MLRGIEPSNVHTLEALQYLEGVEHETLVKTSQGPGVRCVSNPGFLTFLVSGDWIIFINNVPALVVTNEQFNLTYKFKD